MTGNQKLPKMVGNGTGFGIESEVILPGRLSTLFRLTIPVNVSSSAVVQSEAALPRSWGMMLRLLSLAYLPLSRAQVALLWEHFCQTSALNEPQSCVAIVDGLLERGDLVLQNGRIQCHLAHSEAILSTLKTDSQKAHYQETIRTIFKLTDYRHGYFVRHFQEGVRDLRLALYCGRYDDFSKLSQTLQNYFASDWRLRNPYLTIFDSPFSEVQFNQLPNEMALTVAAVIVMVRTSRFESCKDALAWLRERARLAPPEQRQWFAGALCEPLIVRGHLNDARHLLQGQTFPLARTMEGLIMLLQGQLAAALEHYEAALRDSKKPQDLRKTGLTGLGGVGYVIALIATGEVKALEKASVHIAQVIRSGSSLSAIFACMGQVARAAQAVPGQNPDDYAEMPEKDSLALLFRSLACWWVDGAGDRIDVLRLTELARKAAHHGYRWVAAEAWALLDQLTESQPLTRGAPLLQEINAHSIMGLIRRQPLWERSLCALERLGEDQAQNTRKATHYRFCWVLSRHPESGRLLLEGREQKRQTQGNWGLPKAITIQRLTQPHQEPEGVSDQDRMIIASIRLAVVDQKPQEKRLDASLVMGLLVAHPHVYWNHDFQRPIKVVAGRWGVQVKKERHHWHLLPQPKIAEGVTAIHQESSHRLRHYGLTDNEAKIANILGQEGQHIPLDQEERLQTLWHKWQPDLLISAPASMASPATHPAQEKIHVLLSPHPAGLSLELVIYPLGESHDHYSPGEGCCLCFDQQQDPPVLVERHLARETHLAETIMALCQPWLTIGDLPPYTGISQHPAAACEILTLLKETQPNIPLRWPMGESLRIRSGPPLNQLGLEIQSQGDWLQIQGQVTLDEKRVIELKALLELARQPDHRFVALSDGQYMALSEGLLARIRTLASLAQHQEEGLFVPSLAAPSLSALLDDNVQVKTDDDWISLLARQASLNHWEPPIPAGLKAELRDYQRQGFHWLVRHGEAGSGACLADDMGLGKTLQTLTLLLYRAPLGPALVIAPTSVCGNWVQEAGRFAPDLNLRWYSSGNIDLKSDAAKAGDLVILSYTLFQQEMEVINGQRWATCVLDEAQAIKNSSTKRSQAAMKIPADFRLVTTGTPIENHLGELWNLFRFINPGLLGSLDSFTDKFAHPIERNQDQEARDRLRRLIQPFILRRTKSQVLTELPQRTEVTLRLEPNEDERSMYQAVRLEALEDATLGADQPNRIRVLAGIMKLRRACCHGALIVPQQPWVSTKITALLEIVEELKGSGHRALIFSQFVDYLHLIRRAIEERNISYQYLDGSTPSADRSRRVKQFQEGEDDVFLISLKAGGVGLNLTAADYVIHMDPWWNPAVEDQASDRAHRIGQKRPVTVYRLIIKDSIEEKIVALHERKRNLADSLLEGAGESTTLSTEELIGLLIDQP